MSTTPLRLKKSTGWFAAGQEVAAALEILSAAAFQLYLYLCLNADRHTGRMWWEPTQVARALRSGPESVMTSLEELGNRQVCSRHGSAPVSVEICDRFWPYEKIAVADQVDPASYLRQVRQMLLAPACVRAVFTAADERLALSFHRRGLSADQLQRAIWLGCARKYVTLLNGQTPMPITSLHYFSAIVDEVAETTAGNGYWEHVRVKVQQLERRWIETRRKASCRPENEMMETK